MICQDKMRQKSHYLCSSCITKSDVCFELIDYSNKGINVLYVIHL